MVTNESYSTKTKTRPPEYDRYDRNYRILQRIICPLIKKRVDFSGDAIPDDLGPTFILCNHNTDFDFLLVASQSRKTMDFVATETMLRMGAIPNFFCRKFNVILHDKGSKGVGTIKQIRNRISDGRNVLLFPEGNRSFDGRTGEVSEAIGGIVKMTGAALVVYRITGGYFTTPRWGKGIRKGKMKGTTEVLLSAEEVKKMPVKELQKLIENGLKTDAYSEQEKNPIPFRSHNAAEYLESLLFICPECRNITTLKSKRKVLSCGCGFRSAMDEYGYIIDEKGKKKSITELYSDQKRYLSEAVEGSGDSILWSDNVKLCRLMADHNIAGEEQTKLTVFNDHMMIGLQRIDLEQISSIDIVRRNRLIIHVKNSDVRYEFTSDMTFNAVKYLLWYELSVQKRR